MVEQREKETNNRIGLTTIAIFSFLIIFYKCASHSIWNDIGVIKGINFNIVAYAVSFLGAVLIGVTVYSLSSRLVLGGTSKRMLNVAYSIFLVIFILFVCLVYRDEPKLYAGYEFSISFFREQVQSRRVFLAVAMAVSILVYSSINKKIKEKTRTKQLRLMISLAVACVCALLSFAPNVYKNNKWGIYHVDAYINSIINVAHFIPYNTSTTSIYGHYGIIYLPFVKLFGDSTFAIIVAISLFVLIMYLSISHILDFFIDNDLLFTITLIAISGISTTYFGAGQYYQGYPHRMLFCFFVINLIILYEKNQFQTAKRLLVSVSFGMIACLFNLETGMVCATVMGIYEFMNGNAPILKRFSRIVWIAVFCVICFCGAYAIVCIYNKLVGGQLTTIKDFVYPIGSDAFDMQSILRTPLYESGGFILQLFVFFSMTTIYVHKLIIRNEVKNRTKDIVALCLAMSGIGVMTYFMNRTAPTCLAISHIQFVMCMGIACQELGWHCEGVEHNPEVFFKNASSVILCVFCIYFALEGFIGLGGALNDRNNTVWDTKSYARSIKVLQDEVPENTLGVFMGEAYYSLGWTNMVYTMDWADITDCGIKKISEEVGKADSFLILEVMRGEKHIYEPEGFHIRKKVETPDFTALLYEKDK